MVTPAPPTGWDFSTGDSIRDEVWSRFGSPVHFSSHFSRSTFRLVVDVPRSSFRLTSSSVALALRAAIGGSPSDLHVDPLIDRSFTFLVCSKKVGLWIYSLRSFSCKDFSVRYFLWKNGGPDWRREWDLWQAEQYNEWTIVKRRYSSGNRSQHLIKASSVFDRLKFDIPSSPKRIAQKSDSIVSKEIFLANSDPKGTHLNRDKRGILPFQIRTDLGWFVFGVWALITSSGIAARRLDVCIVKVWAILKSFALLLGLLSLHGPIKWCLLGAWEKNCLSQKRSNLCALKLHLIRSGLKKIRNPLRLLLKLLAL
jgi:hypothetical protein